MFTAAETAEDVIQVMHVLLLNDGKKNVEQLLPVIAMLRAEQDDVAIGAFNEIIKHIDTQRFYIPATSPVVADRLERSLLYFATNEDMGGRALLRFLMRRDTSDNSGRSRTHQLMAVALAVPLLWPVIHAAFTDADIDWREVVAPMAGVALRELRAGLAQQWMRSAPASWPFAADWRAACGILTDGNAPCAELAVEQLLFVLGGGDSLVIVDPSETEARVIVEHYGLSGLDRDFFMQQLTNNKAGLSVGDLLTLTAASLK